MKRTSLLLAALVIAAGAPTAASAVDVVQNDTLTLNMHGYLQAFGVGEEVPGNVSGRNTDRVYLFLKEARLRWDGSIYGVKFDIMLAPGGEDLTPNTNSALGLLDFNFDVPLPENTSVKIGQFLVPYGRERLTDDPTMNFGDRSVENLGFYWNRDYGVALSTYQGKLAGTFAVMSGGGRDVPQRYLPEELGVPMLVARIGYNDGIDRDIYHVSASDSEDRWPQAIRTVPERPKSAVFVNGLYIKDSAIGHSTVLNVRATDKDLLVDPNYNPFIARAPFSLSTIYQGGGDAVYRAPIGSSAAFNAEGQVDYSHFNNKYGSLDLKGGRLQAGISKDKLELDVRYAALFLDTRMAYVLNGVSNPIVRSKTPIQEITPALTYNYRTGIKVVLDAPYYLKMVVFRENTVGSYLLSEQPDQVTVNHPGTSAGTGTVVRKNIAEGRLMIQLGF